MKKLTIISILLLLIVACKPNQNKKGNDKNNSIESLIVYDSIEFINKFYDIGIILTDFEPNKNILLGFDWLSKDVIIIHTKNKEITTFNKIGNGPGEYNEIRGLSFYNDSTIILLSLSSVLFYNLKGEFIRLKSIKFAGIFQSYNLFRFNIPYKKNKNGDTIIYIRHYNTALDKGDYKNIKWLSELNLSKNQVKTVFKLDKDNPLYNLGDKRYDRFPPSFSDVIYDSLIYFSYPFTPALYCYNTNNYKINKSKSIFFQIDNFNAIKYSRSAGTDKAFLVSQRTDDCNDFFISNDNYFLIYSKGIPQKEVVKTRAEYVKNDIYEKYRNDYLIIKNKNGKECSTILLRNSMNEKQKVLYIVSRNEIYLLISNDNQEENVSKIYVAKYKKQNSN